jgi:hypothetical protein
LIQFNATALSQPEASKANKEIESTARLASGNRTDPLGIPAFNLKEHPVSKQPIVVPAHHARPLRIAPNRLM